MYSMHVQKRNGSTESISFNKVLQRIRKAAKGLAVNPDGLAQQVLARIVNGIKTSDLDELAAQMSASLCTTHEDWGTLASRIAVSNHQKNTETAFTKVVQILSNQFHKTGDSLSYLSADLVAFVEANGPAIDAYINHERDYDFDYFGFKTLEKSYLLKDTAGKVIERPQHMWMRVAVGIWMSGKDPLPRIFETYDLLSQKFMTHATPTLFNAGTPRPQLSSCYLLAMANDSIAGIYKTLGDCAAISKYAGGIGLHLHNVRARGSLIRGTNGQSNGLIPMLRVFNNTARYVDQCFTGDTLITTSNGNIPINQITVSDFVLTSGCQESLEESGKHYVESSSGHKWCMVRKVVEHLYDGIILEVETEFGTVQMTPSHPVLTSVAGGKDYVEIGKLSVGDVIHGFSESKKNMIISMTEKYFNGTLYDLEIDGTHDYTVAHLGIVHNGGGKRNGSFAMYLEPWHADVEDFLRMKLNTGAEEERARDLFYALWIPDLFMKRVETDADWSLFCPDEAPGLADVWGDAFEELYTSYEAKGRARKTVSARKLWFQILDSQMETGTPYLLYKDAANSKSNQMNIGTIKSSNLCVAPETYILTDKGHVQIHELENQFVNVWNGEKWSNTQICKTGVQQKLVTVRLSNGAEIHCTPYHKFIIRESYSDHKSLKDAVRVPASELQEGMKLAKYDLAVIEGNPDNDFNHPYTHGFFCGDGTTTGIHKRKICSLYGVKKELVPHLAIQSMSGKEDAIGRLNVVLDQSIPDKFEVPTNSSIRCRLEWLAGLFDADGTVVTNGGNESLQLASIHLDFLDRIRLMLQTLGVQSKVIKCFDERQTLLPDGHGGRKLFDCKPLWRILISSSSLYRLYNLGFRCHRLTFTAAKPQRNAEQFVTVLSVVDYERFDDTYCFNEPENHAGVFNGVLTGNCTEIMEVSTPEETAVCNLASLALPAFVKEKAFDFETLRNTVKVAVRNLNQIIDINFYPTPETKVSNMRHRPIGIGVQGLADVFAMLGIAWESPAAADLNKRIFEHLYYAAVEESAALASTEGSYETFVGSPASKGMLQPDLWSVAPLTQEDETLDWTALRQKAARGLRNSLLVAPMPTASTSQILGYNECFEPFTSNIYTRRTLAGEFIVINRHLMRELMHLGLWNDDMKQQIVVNNGSIQALEKIPAEVRARYKTTWEIPQKVLIDMAADRGAFICQSQSLNLFVADPNYAKLTSMHFYGWKKGLKTGCYYLRTKAPVAAQKFTVDPRLLAAVAGGSTPANQEDADEDASDDETSDDEKPVKPQETRKEKLERLSREYEEEVARSKAAADAGEGCLLCSS
jgi:ribonucleoside-diphosphate reductase alpha chain